jgi:hypothetical protein
MKTSLKNLLVTLVLLASLTQAAWATVAFTVTPNAVSNTYVGPITLQVTGLASGDSVVVQKFGDANSNGVIDAGDLLVQQFNLTDGSAGMVIGGVTNINVPGDTDTIAGQITAKLNFPGGDFVQNIVVKCLFKLSSPAGHFLPMTNGFNVTNFPFGPKITGNVVSSGVNVPYATVLFFPAPRGGDNGSGTPVAGMVANSAGAYTIQLPPGTYVPMALKSNYVANYTTSPILTLKSSPITTNLSLTIATASISGKLVDVLNPGIGLPGLFVPAMNSSGFIGTGTSDTNGNFTIRVTSGQWQLDGSPLGLDLHGYVAYNNGTNINAGTTGFIGAFYKATSLFYGTMKDDSGNPLPGIAIGASDNNYQIFDNDGYSDANGNYVTGAVGGLGSGDPWHAEVNHKSEHPNYLFSQSPLEQNGGTNLAAGQAVLQNFTAVLATNQISGHVQFNGTNVIGVQVYARATIGGVSYHSEADTDGNGNYSFNVANSNDWNVNVLECCDNDSLDNILGNGNYVPPNSQDIAIANNNGTANFTVQLCGGISIITTSPLPDGTNGVSYYTQLQASSCSGNLNWSLNDPADFPPGLAFDSAGEIYNTPNGNGTYNFSVNVNDGNGHSTNQSFSLYIAPGSPLQITTTSLPNGTNGVFYSQQLQATGATPPYYWWLPDGTASLPPGESGDMNFSSDGTISGTPGAAGTYTFRVGVYVNNPYQAVTQQVSLTITGPLQITTTYLPNGTNGAFYSQTLQASGGQPPYSWAVANYSLDPPPNLTLATNGVLSGTLATNGGPFSFDVEVTDGAASTVYQTLSVYVVNPPLPPLVITNVGLPNGNVGAAYSAQLGATGGQPPYYWSIATGSANPPAGLTLYSSGLISGTPTANKVSTFKVQATDANFTTTNKVLSITINSKPVLGSPSWLMNQFKMQLTGASNQNYTIQVSTNLSSSNWIPLVITNSTTTNSFIVVDPNATNNQRFYRILIGP